MLILCGKTASGKDTIKKELVKKGLSPVVSYTTRPMREGEIEGITYHYITEEEFLKKKKEGFFAETTSYHVAVDGGTVWHYGSAVKDIVDGKIMIMNPEGLKAILKNPEVHPVVFYITVDDETIWNRLRLRGDNSEEARRRLNADDEDFKGMDKFIDFAVKNDGSESPKFIAKMIWWLYLNKKKYEQMRE